MIAEERRAEHAHHAIVNLDRVRHVEPHGGSDYQFVLHNDVRLRTGRSRRDHLWKAPG